MISYYTLVWPQWWSFADVSQQGVDFSKRIIKIKIIFWFDFHRCSHGPSKIGHHLENKVVQKLKFSKNDKNKKPSSKLIFFSEKKKSERFEWFWHRKLTLNVRFRYFLWPLWTSVKVKSKNYSYFTDFCAKIKPLLTHVCKYTPLRSH